jgi:hypothetical protein
MLNGFMKQLLVCFFFLFPSFMYAQQVDSILVKYSEQFAPEHIHVQLDRSVYGTGEIIWFKAYVVLAHNKDMLSKNLYLDWIDDDSKVLAHQVYPISESAISTGLFSIPKLFTGKALHLRAYTKWMLNFDTAFLYHRDIPIVHLQNVVNKNAAVTKTKNDIDFNKNTTTSTGSLVNPTLTFFPEGGDAIAGINCKLAFLSCDQWGRPVNIKGEIKNNKGIKVANIETQHDGMGSFWLLPSSAENYIADWKDENGKTYQTALPKIQPEGITLNISETNGKKKFTILRSDNAPDNLKLLHLVATMHLQPVYMATINLSSEQSGTGLIPEDSLSAGGMIVTVFDKNWQPVAERICFVDRLDASTFKTSIIWEKKSLEKRGYNQLLITIADSLASNLSISVTDAGLPKDTINSRNILSDLLLSGDIRGRVHNADYYFSDTTEKIQTDLDLVMLTHGWRRYDWSKIIKGVYPTITYPRDTNYYSLSGKVSGISKKKLSNSGSLFLVLQEQDSTKQSKMVTVNKDGSFAVPVLLFDSTKIYYRFTGKKDPSAYMNFNLDKSNLLLTALHASVNKNTPLYAPVLGLKDTAADNRQDYFLGKQDQHRAKELDTVTVRGHRKSEVEKMHDMYVNNPLYKGNGIVPSFFLDVEHSAAIPVGSIADYLEGRVPGFRYGQWFYRSPVPIMFFYITDEGAPSEDPPNMSMSDVAYIEAFPPPFAGVVLNAGAILIYTKKGNDVEADTRKMPSVYSEGYTPLKEFYLPNYSGKDSSNHNEDVRPTIYWNPVLLTNKNANKVRVGFYNNDISNSFRLVLEGIDSDGKITYFEEEIK